MNVPTPGASDPQPGSRDTFKLLIGALACGALALAVLPFEPPILAACNLAPTSSGLGFWRWVDRVAPSVLLTLTVVLGAGTFLFATPSPRSRRSAVVLLCAFVVALGITWVLKTGLGRHRPLADPAQGLLLWSPLDLKDDRSFPSGHVCCATAICASLWLASRRGLARNLLWAAPPMMMFDRMCLAVHWPSDVLGGGALGLASVALVGRLAELPAADRAAGWFGRGGSSRLRFLLVVVAWLLVTRFWRELPLGRDPVSGEVVAGFTTKPQFRRVLCEPLVGPPLQAALEDVRALLYPGLAWYVAIVLACQKNRRLLGLAIGFPVIWLAWFVLGWSMPDRFVAKDRTGIFVDWHLHADDPHDGERISSETLGERLEQRGVAWGILTPHSITGIDPGDVPDAPGPWLGEMGTEWSGPLPAPGGRWTTPHVLVLGERPALDAANAQKTVLDAIRAGRKAGGLVIVAHYWRSQTIPQCPTFEELVEAGAHGFEVGNRRRETRRDDEERLAILDRECRERGLLRFSFSDDHGVPAGSPCVTFLEGVDASDLSRKSALAILDALRRGDASVKPVPLLFHPGDPGRAAPWGLQPPVMAFEYFRSLRFAQQASWLAWAALASLWLFRRRGVEGPR